MKDFMRQSPKLFHTLDLNVINLSNWTLNIFDIHSSIYFIVLRNEDIYFNMNWCTADIWRHFRGNHLVERMNCSRAFHSLEFSKKGHWNTEYSDQNIRIFYGKCLRRVIIRVPPTICPIKSYFQLYFCLHVYSDGDYHVAH